MHAFSRVEIIRLTRRNRPRGIPITRAGIGNQANGADALYRILVRLNPAAPVSHPNGTRRATPACDRGTTHRRKGSTLLAASTALATLQTGTDTCTYYTSKGSVVASDLLIDNKLHPFYTTVNNTAKPANCANMWDLLAVVVHERGHTAGLAHVDQTKHAVATMSPRTLACDSSEVTLSAGDLAPVPARSGRPRRAPA